jgi:hypothetical protein
VLPPENHETFCTKMATISRLQPELSDHLWHGIPMSKRFSKVCATCVCFAQIYFCSLFIRVDYYYEVCKHDSISCHEFDNRFVRKYVRMCYVLASGYFCFGIHRLSINKIK